MVLNTCPDETTAHTIASILVQDKLAACVNIIPALQSVYQWKGQIETAEEYLIIIKSRADVYPRLEKTIKAHHPYELPEILEVPIDTGQPDYLSWIDKHVRKE